MAVPRLKEKYLTSIVPAMRETYGYTNVMQVPKVTKVTLNMGIGEGTHDAKAMEEAANQLGQIAGQKAQIRRARKSVANFKLRTGMPVGLRVTLRGDTMYEMLDRLARAPRHVSRGGHRRCRRVRRSSGRPIGRRRSTPRATPRRGHTPVRRREHRCRRAAARRHRNIFDHDFYIEIQNNLCPEDQRLRRDTDDARRQNQNEHKHIS